MFTTLDANPIVLHLQGKTTTDEDAETVQQYVYLQKVPNLCKNRRLKKAQGRVQAREET